MENQEALVQCGTTKGPFTLRLIRKWSPLGYDRAVDLFQRSFYDHSHFFRTVHGFLVQFGISYTTDVELRHFANTAIPDDPQLHPPITFEEGIVSFAGGGKDSRTSQLFIAYGAVPSLGTQVWETPIGKVIEGMQHVRNFYEGYGDMPPWGKGPEQGRIRKEGADYMESNFPLMDRFETCTVEIEYPNLLQHDERDLENDNNEKDVKDKLLLLRGKPDTGSGGRTIKTLMQIPDSILGNVRSKETSKMKDHSNVDVVRVALGVAILTLAIIACLLRRNRKLADKTN